MLEKLFNRSVISTTVVKQKRWTKTLISMHVARPAGFTFVAGQYFGLGVVIDGVGVLRPYSVVSAENAETIEILYVVIAGGALTPTLAALKPNDEVFISPTANGCMTLYDVPQADTLWLIATGTGIGPFVSIARSCSLSQHAKRVVVVHGVRGVAELAYRQELQQQQVSYVAVVSREEVAKPLLYGRIDALLANNGLEKQVGETITANDQFFVCGNPAMLQSVTRQLIQRGLKKHRSKAPGQITTEHYWLDG